MPRNHLLLMLAVVGFAGAASFAGAQEGPKRSPAAVVDSNWGGFYVGGHIGYARGGDPHLSENDTILAGSTIGPSFLRPVGIHDRDSGALGGLHIGYNWQFAPNWLVGLEGDWSWTGLKPGGTVAPLIVWNGTVASGASVTMHTDVRSIGSVRGRFGVTQPRWMAYVTGGPAFADLGFTGDTQCPLGICPTQDDHAPVSFSRVRSGWVVGGGMEFKGSASPWILGIEYLYYNFAGDDRASSGLISVATGVPDQTVAGCTPPTQCMNYSFGGLAIQTARLRLSYKFDWVGQP